MGQTLDYTCVDTDETLSNSTSDTFTITCEILPLENDPFYEMNFNFDIWPKCDIPESNRRKKRQIIPLQYQYINVIVDVQFKEYNLTTEDEVRYVIPIKII